MYTLTSLTLSSIEQVWSYSCKNGRWILWGDSWSLSLALSSIRYVPYLLESLGGILGDILGDILMLGCYQMILIVMMMLVT